MANQAAVGSELAPLVRVRLVDEIAERLRGYILGGSLAPGQQLRQVELAERLGVSRTPLREAFRVLERDGFLRIANGNQTVEVVDLTPDELLDLYEVREVVDGLAACCCARVGLSEEAAASLARCLSVMEESTETMDMVHYNDAHVDFHTAIVLNCGNPRVYDLLPIIRLTSSSSVTRITRKLWTGHHTVPVEEVVLRQFRVGNDHHRAIYDAIRAGDPAAAESCARVHISATIKTIRRLAGATEEDAPVDDARPDGEH